MPRKMERKKTVFFSHMFHKNYEIIEFFNIAIGCLKGTFPLKLFSKP
jgi:hypothetical protein